MMRDYHQVTVADTATSSASFQADDRVFVGLWVPAEFDGTTVSFQSGVLPPGKATPKDDFTSTANFVFYPIYDTTNTIVQYTVAASRYYAIPRGSFDGVRTMKLVTGAQTGDTIFTLVSMPLGA